MKLDFFDRFLGRERKKKPRESIDSSKLRDWLDKKIGSGRDEICEECEPLIEDILQTLEEIRTLALDIEKRKCPEDIPKKARKIVDTSKPAFVRGILDAISTADKKPSGYEELRKFHASLQATVSSLGKIGVGQGRYLPIAFGEEIYDLRRKSKKLLEKTGELTKKIDSEITLLSKALEKQGEIDARVKDLEDLNAGKSNIEKKLGEYTGEENNLKKEIDSLYKTRDFKELAETEKKIGETKEKIESVELDIYNQINPLKRPMKKFRKYAESKGCAPEILRDIDEYTKNPAECFLSDKNNRLENILTEIKKAIKTGDFKLKDKDKGKILDKIESALDTGRDGLRQEYQRLKAASEDLQRKIGSYTVNEKRKELERRIEHIKREMKTCEDEMEKIEGKKKNIREEISGKRRELEHKLNNIEGCRIKIKWADA